MTTEFQQQRVKMVDGQVRTTDVTYIPLLSAMLSVPREAFVPQTRAALAYIDEDIEVSAGSEGGGPRYLMEPSPFARLVQLAKPVAGDTVLDVGGATGYSAAVLSQVSGRVFMLESDQQLVGQARETLASHGYDNVTVVEGPLTEGHAEAAPYNVIVINGAVDEVPPALLDQLADGGRLVTVVGDGNSGQATLFVKEDGLVSARHAFNAAIRPLDEFRKLPAFEF